MLDPQLIQDTISRISMPERIIHYGEYVYKAGVIPVIAPYLQVSFERLDTDTGMRGTGYGRQYLLNKCLTTNEVVLTALAACIAIAEHEVRENFMVDGERVFGPHPEIDDMVELARRKRLKEVS